MENLPINHVAVFVCGILNLALLFWRMRSEDEALKPLREEPSPADVPPEA